MGSGTELEYLQVLGSEDDGIEWFGGTVGMRYLVINAPDDDALDQDQGWQGYLQNALVRMGDNDGDRGMESDNNGDDFDAEPRTRPIIANVTILGNRGKGSSQAVVHREGYGGQIWRSAYLDDSLRGGQFAAGCFNIDDQANSASGLTYQDVIYNCAANKFVDAESQTNADANFTEGENVFSDTSATINPSTFAVTPSVDLGGLTDIPQVALDRGIRDEGYIGAVDPDAVGDPWWQGWTVDVPSDAGANFNGSLEDQTFHPLAAEIQDGTLSAADPADGCPAGTAISGEDEPTTVDVAGTEFPVCLIDVDILEDTTLTNDRVYVVLGNRKVGNGSVRDTAPADALDVTLTIEAGTQLFGAAGTQTQLRVTRGADIVIDGTAELPVIMSAVAYDIGSGEIEGDPTDFTGRGQWGGLVIDGYAPINGGS